MNIIEELESLIANKIGVVQSIYKLMKLEARLSARLMSHLLLSAFLFFVVFLALWFITMGLLGYILNVLLGSLLYAIGIVWILNVVITLILIKCIITNLSRMSFKKTRDYFSNKESDYENLNQAIDSRNKDDRTNIISSTK